MTTKNEYIASIMLEAAELLKRDVENLNESNELGDVNKKIKLKIWGHLLDIRVIYDTYKGEEILDKQKDALKKFIASSSKLFEIAENEAKKYCLKVNRNEITEDEISNILKYIKPKSIYVKRESSKDRIVALLCAYKFNPDDGIAIVFKNEAFSKIGTENIIL